MLWCLQVEVAQKYTTVETLRQQYLFVPAKHKDCYLTFVLNELSGSTFMVGPVIKVVLVIHTSNVFLLLVPKTVEKYVYLEKLLICIRLLQYIFATVFLVMELA